MTELAERGADAPFAPDWVSPPGDTILDLLEERDWTQQQLADRLGYSLKHVNQLIKGKVPLTDEAAIRLQNVLGASVGFCCMPGAKPPPCTMKPGITRWNTVPS